MLIKISRYINESSFNPIKCLVVIPYILRPKALLWKKRDWKPGEPRAMLRYFVMENGYNYQPQGPFDHLFKLKRNAISSQI